MIKFTGTKDDGTRIIGFVLEPGNIRRMKRDEPILVDVHGMAPDIVPHPCELVIAYDDDIHGAAQTLLKHLAADAKVHIIPRGPGRPQ